MDGFTARDAGLDRVSGNNLRWSEELLFFIEECLPVGWVGTGEDIRMLALDVGLYHPNHSNAWGAAIMTAVRHRKLLEKTGRLIPMRVRSSHARQTPEYKRVD
jgi:hypothetical protein